MITLTETAAGKLGGIMEQKGMQDTHALRVFVKGGGCGGMQYGMTFDTAREGDEVYEQHGMRVIVDPTSMFYIDGASIDYIDENEILARSSDPERTYIEDILPAKLALDLRYVQERSLALDLRILLITVRRVLTGFGGRAA